VPQVLAAAFAVSALSGQVATVVKLARVLILGPVVVFFSLRGRKRSTSATSMTRAAIVPWFVIGFVVLATLCSLGAIPESSAAIAKIVAGWLTIGAMAALGLSVDVHSVRRVGARVVIAVAGSLAALLLLSVGLIRLLAIR
jgi:uncharacterized membrane protein YadS